MHHQNADGTPGSGKPESNQSLICGLSSQKSCHRRCGIQKSVEGKPVEQDSRHISPRHVGNANMRPDCISTHLSCVVQNAT